MSDLQDLVTHRGEEAYATFLDFEKAYDRVDWSYMFAVLSKMNCGNSFIQWTQLLYNNTNVSLLLNGTLSPKITPSRGVKQGDPLSALLLLMTIEPLRILMRRNEGPGIYITPTNTATSFFLPMTGPYYRLRSVAWRHSSRSSSIIVMVLVQG
uniref:Reverse transcriptase putative n=1 Tax=Albugo laibachii Nc14 TaxID=890382 RepID=F0WF46_9STRA|nr:reverse transcriptase putative [Albugo laibachii Nc14]|eukprot:CCA19828.1 reverse transcriptase putative [Albugo laibachii Nc14]